MYFGTKSFKRSQKAEFYITKENIIIYNLFDDLFNNCKNAKVYFVDEFDLQFCDTEEQIQFKYDEYNEWNNHLKQSFVYKKLVSDNTITWISDDSLSFDDKTGDGLKIIKEDNQYKLKFTYYEDEFPHVRSIRIRNSGSRYYPFNIIMMNFFNKLQEYNPKYHQIHIEEYLYNTNCSRKLVKK
jgi:hypothetical protein